MSAGRPFLALVKYHVVASVSMTRWRLVPAAYLFLFIVYIIKARKFPWAMQCLPADANVWDVGLQFTEDVFYDVLILLFGLILLLGDDLARGHQNGTMRSTLLLSRSVERWWKAKVLAMGVCTFAYMSIVFVALILASLVMGVRVELATSAAAARIPSLKELDRWYPLPAGWSTLGYEGFSMISMAYTMWVVVVLYHVASLFIFPNRRIPLFVFFVWAMAGFVVHASQDWWDLRFWLYPGKYFPEFRGHMVSAPLFFGFVTAILVGAAVLGYRRLSRMDL